MPVAAAAGLFLMDDDSTVRLLWENALGKGEERAEEEKLAIEKRRRLAASAGGAGGAACSMEE
jgi:hypothetical protein